MNISILSQRLVGMPTIIIVLAFIIAAVCLLGGLASYGQALDCPRGTKEKCRYIVIGSVGVVIAIFIGIFAIMTLNGVYDYTEYIVLVGDDVPFNDFFAKYEVISQMGDGLYVVKDII